MNQDSQQHSMDMAVDVLGTGSGLHQDEEDLVPIEELEAELPQVDHGQLPLGELLSRVVQAIYTELTELTETLPSMSDAVRKRTIADWVVKTKKQVVKLYAVAKWSRDADTVQKCMNITGFLGGQNKQFKDAIAALGQSSANLDQARLRNHDLLTSLDVLTTGSYLRLPTCIKKEIIPEPQLTDEQVAQTLLDMESVILYRLRMSEMIPVEMSRYRIEDGRVFFVVPKLFEVSLCLTGPAPKAGWFFVDVEFHINVQGDAAALQEFPRIPTGFTKQFITEEADRRLGCYALPDEDPNRVELPVGVVDTPLIRLYNFMEMLSLSYQLEILWFQAERMRSLGWAEHMSVQMSPDRKTLTVNYWTRPPPPVAQGGPHRNKHKPLPLFGGTLEISIRSIKKRAARTPEQIVLARLQQHVKLRTNVPSDEIEHLKLTATWKPSEGVLAVNIPPSELSLPPSELEIDAENLDFESLIDKIIVKHAQALLVALTNKLQNESREFSAPGVVVAEKNALHLHLCTDESVTINIDTRTGRLNLRDINSLAVTGRAPRFYWMAFKLNQNPEALVEVLSALRTKTIIDLADEKARYLGYQSFRTRNIVPEGLQKLYKGEPAKGQLFIQLRKTPSHYLVLIIRDDGFSHALISTRPVEDHNFSYLTVQDIAFIDFDRIKKNRYVVDNVNGASMRSQGISSYEPNAWMSESRGSSGFDVSIQAMKELYSYCCARVAYLNVERQFKALEIDFIHVNPEGGASPTPELSRLQSSLVRSVPALLVAATDVLCGAPAAEAAMPNIRVIPLNWWSDSEPAQVVTCVKLKYVQQPMGKRAGSSKIIRPSKRIIYDTTEAVVSFLSENVDQCVDEFLKEWATVSKMVVIAREVAKLSKEKGWSDIQLLSFDLQTVEFAYAPGYSVSITWEELDPSNRKFDLRFTRNPTSATNNTANGSSNSSVNGSEDADSEDTFNPHDDAEPFLSKLLQHGQGMLAPSLRELITMLRDSLPMVVELEKIRKAARMQGYHVDTFAKASGWYRLLYPTLRHALDFRLMTNRRVAILDASHSLFKPSNVRIGGAAKGKAKAVGPTEPPTALTSTSSTSQAPAAGTAAASSSSSSSSPNVSASNTSSSLSTSTSASLSTSPSKSSIPPENSVLLQPIPGFSSLTKEAVDEARSLIGGAGTDATREMVDIRVGVICDASAVGLVAHRVHEGVVEKLKAAAASAAAAAASASAGASSAPAAALLSTAAAAPAATTTSTSSATTTPSTSTTAVAPPVAATTTSPAKP